MPRQRAEQYRIGRGERGAENGGGGSGEPEKLPGGEGDEGRGEQRARHQDGEGESFPALELAGVHADRVGEEHQYERESGDHLEGRRVEREVHQPETPRAECDADQEKDGDLGQPGPLHHAREERRDQDHDPDQGEGGGERVEGHGEVCRGTGALRQRVY